MASQDARLTKFEADFKQQQSEMTNKIDTVLKAITDRIGGALPSDTVKNLKLSSYPVLSAHSYLTEDPQCSTHVHVWKNDDSRKEEPEAGEQEVKYFNVTSTRSGGGLIRYKAYGNLYAKTQVDSHGYAITAFNSRGLVGDERRDYGPHQIHEEILFLLAKDGVDALKRRRRDPSSDGIRDLVTASGRGRLNEDLEYPCSDGVEVGSLAGVTTFWPQEEPDPAPFSEAFTYIPSNPSTFFPRRRISSDHLFHPKKISE
ncbi:hypothetical protein Tco_0009782 [Tanacetum coccineum]